MVTFTDMEPALDQRVGKPLPKVNYPIEYAFVRREVDAEKYELVSRRPDRCNYILTVRTADGAVIGWRFVADPAPQGCRFQDVRQLM